MPARPPSDRRSAHAALEALLLGQVLVGLDSLGLLPLQVFRRPSSRRSSVVLHLPDPGLLRVVLPNGPRIRFLCAALCRLEGREVSETGPFWIVRQARSGFAGIRSVGPFGNGLGEVHVDVAADGCWRWFCTGVFMRSDIPQEERGGC